MLYEIVKRRRTFAEAIPLQNVKTHENFGTRGDSFPFCAERLYHLSCTVKRVKRFNKLGLFSDGYVGTSRDQ